MTKSNSRELGTEEGLTVRVSWAVTESPDFSHYGRFIARASDARDNEVPLRNPRAWDGDEQNDRNLLPYFAISRDHFESAMSAITPETPDTAVREEAVRVVEALWEDDINRIGSGDYHAIDVTVTVSAKGIDLASETFSDIEVEDDIGDDEANALWFVRENGSGHEVIGLAVKKLRELMPVALLHGLTGQQSDALLLAAQFFIVNAEEDDDGEYADAKAALTIIEAQLKGEGVA